MFWAIVLTSPEDVHLLMTQLAESFSLHTADQVDAAHSFSVCDLPVVGGPTKIEKRFNGISCAPLTYVVVMPPTNAVVFTRLVATWPALALKECAFC